MRTSMRAGGAPPLLALLMRRPSACFFSARRPTLRRQRPPRCDKVCLSAVLASLRSRSSVPSPALPAPRVSFSFFCAVSLALSGAAVGRLLFVRPFRALSFSLLAAAGACLLVVLPPPFFSGASRSPLLRALPWRFPCSAGWRRSLALARPQCAAAPAVSLRPPPCVSPAPFGRHPSPVRSASLPRSVGIPAPLVGIPALLGCYLSVSLWFAVILSVDNFWRFLPHCQHKYLVVSEIVRIFVS